jgi:hypothetical protein
VQAKFIATTGLGVLITLSGCAAPGGGGGVPDNRSMALYHARQVGCDRPPVSHRVISPGVEVLQFECPGQRLVTFTCRQGSCSGE